MQEGTLIHKKYFIILVKCTYGTHMFNKNIKLGFSIIVFYNTALASSTTARVRRGSSATATREGGSRQQSWRAVFVVR